MMHTPPEPPMLGIEESYWPQNARLRELARLRKPDLLARWLRLAGGDASDPKMPGGGPRTASLSRDQLIAALLEAG